MAKMGRIRVSRKCMIVNTHEKVAKFYFVDVVVVRVAGVGSPLIVSASLIGSPARGEMRIADNTPGANSQKAY